MVLPSEILFYKLASYLHGPLAQDLEDKNEQEELDIRVQWLYQ